MGVPTHPLFSCRKRGVELIHTCHAQYLQRLQPVTWDLPKVLRRDVESHVSLLELQFLSEKTVIISSCQLN